MRSRPSLTVYIISIFCGISILLLPQNMDVVSLFVPLYYIMVLRKLDFIVIPHVETDFEMMAGVIH